MFRFSLRQLFRNKGKALLFFLLMAASTALVLTGSVMTIENARRIAKVESTYSTIGMVEQLPTEETRTIQSEDSCTGTNTWTTQLYGDPMMMDTLDFPGADYIIKPEQRPYFMTYQPDMQFTWGLTRPRHIVEFTPLESTDGTEPVEIEITRVLHSELNGSPRYLGDGSEDKIMKVGDVLTLAQAGDPTKTPLEVGERYVSNIYLTGICQTHKEVEYHTYVPPWTAQTDPQGRKLDYSGFYAGCEEGKNARIHHVTGDDYYEPGHFGAIYEKWAQLHERENHTFPVMGTNGLEAIPAFHEGSSEVSQGRAMTHEEFAEGAAVCMLSENTARSNHLSVGDKVNLPLMCAMIGGDYIYYYDSPYLNADGELYETFWEQEYEIVGLFTGESGYSNDNFEDVWSDMFIIPIKSVGASWENNISAWNTPSRQQATFQIPNGSIEEFDAALHENVPEAAGLSITYDDRGYTEVMKSLKNSRDMAFLLLMGGILAALAMIALLLYFFVVKEKKRTAIERSLGMSKAQCRVSLLGGLLVLTAVSVIIGAVLGAFALSKVQEQPATSAVAQEPTPEELDSQYKFSTEFSMWATGRELAEEAVIEAETPLAVYFALPAAICLIVELLAWLLLERSFKTDPIYLLSTRETK